MEVSPPIEGRFEGRSNGLAAGERALLVAFEFEATGPGPEITPDLDWDGRYVSAGTVMSISMIEYRIETASLRDI